MIMVEDQNSLYYQLRELSSYCVIKGKEHGLSEELISQLVRGVVRIKLKQSYGNKIDYVESIKD